MKNAGPLCATLMLLAVLFGIAPVVQAVVIASDTGVENTTAPTGFSYWNNLGLRSGGTGIYLGDRWVLTAYHVGVGPVVFNGTTYNAVAGTNLRLKNSDGSLADLLQYRISEDPGLPSLTLATSAMTRSTTVTMIGDGRDRAADPTYWDMLWQQQQNPDWYTGYYWQSTRTMRWGTNRVDTANLLDPTTGGSTYAFTASFSADSGSSECGVADGDSGGGVFAKSGGVWRLAGMIYGLGRYSSQPASTTVFGNVTYMADLGRYAASLRPMEGDANYDGLVDQQDYAVWFNNNALSSGRWDLGDFTGDGMVDQRDYAAWFNHNGLSALSDVSATGGVGSSQPTPEPATMMTLILGGTILSLRRPRRQK